MSKIKLILVVMLTLGLAAPINAQGAQEISAEEEKSHHSHSLPISYKSSRVSIEGHFDTGYYRGEEGQVTLTDNEGKFTAGDSQITVTGELTDRIITEVRASLNNLNLYDDENGVNRDIKIEEVIDKAALKIVLNENSDSAVVIGKISVPAGLSEEEGLFSHQNRLRKHNKMDGHMGVMFKLEGDGLKAARQLVDIVEITGFETQNGDFRIGSGVEGSKTGIGVSLRVTKTLAQNKYLKAQGRVAQVVMNDRDLDAKAYRTSIGIVSDYYGHRGRRLGKLWGEVIIARNFNPKTNEVSASEDETYDTYGFTVGSDKEILDKVFVAMEGTHLKGEVSEFSTSLRREYGSGLSAGVEARIKKYRGQFATGEEQYDLQLGGIIRLTI